MTHKGKSGRRTKNDLRCNCRFHPLLAVWGIGYDNRPYVHVRVFKGGRLFTEVYTRHTVQITCRDCYRKHTIIIRDRTATMSDTEPGRAIVAPDAP